jgi:hypothetical protein
MSERIAMSRPAGFTRMLFRSWPPPNNSVTDQFRSSPKINRRPLQSRTVVEFAGAPRLELTDQNSSPDGGIAGIFFFFMERVFDPSFLFFAYYRISFRSVG